MIKIKLRPLGTWAREQTKDRRNAPFKASRADTDRLLKKEAEHLGCKDQIILQADYLEEEFKIDGDLRSWAKPPEFPGVIVIIESKKLGPLKFYCDEFENWEHNIRGIALTLERLRLADLYGVTKRGEQYTGWKALPAPMLTAPPMTVEEAAGFIAEEAGEIRQAVIEKAATFKTAYRTAAAKLHPDANGQGVRPEWKTLQDAKMVLDRHHQEVG